MIETVQQHIAALEKKVGPDAKSPRFAQLANFYLEVNRAEDALRLCDAGLAHHPFYTTAHLVKGKALAALHMRAEARREFEFVLEFLPRNETIAALLKQIPPGEEETLVAPQHKEQEVVVEPDHVLHAPENYKIPFSPQVPPEPGYGFGGFDQPAQEPQPESPPAPTSLSGPSFFEAITKAPEAITSEDPFGFAAQSIESSVPSEPSSFGGFDVQTPEASSYPEVESTAFADIPRSTPAPSTGFEFSLSTSDMLSATSAPSEEESFEHYASRRRAELTGEETISLEDYLSGAPTEMPETPMLEVPISNATIPDIPLTLGFENRMRESIPHTELPTESEISFPQVQLPDLSFPAEMQEKVEDTYSAPTFPSNEEIILPQAPPPELPMAADIQNNIEEIANKLQGAGKITPVINLAQKETPPASEQDLPVSMGFVTPTLAEIYAKQGWYDDAIKAYKALAHNKPGERERFEKRIEELEKLKSQSSK
jgi:tetratricopeptide (TPR) repeat protein